MAKTYLLLTVIALHCIVSGMNIGRFQDGMNIGRFQEESGESECTTQPTITNMAATCTTGVVYDDTITSTDADSLSNLSALPGGLSVEKTGAGIGRIYGTPTTQSVLDTVIFVAYACSGDSTDTALFIFTIAASDSFTLDTTAVNGSITLSPAPSGSGQYYRGDTVQCTAVDDPYYNFSEWQDSLTGSQNPDTLIMDTNKVLTAVFVPDSVSITSVVPDSGDTNTIITINGTGYGDTQGSSTLFMGDSSMGTAQSWSSTQIVDTVPNGLDTGWVVLIITSPINSDTVDSAFRITSDPVVYDSSITIIKQPYDTILPIGATTHFYVVDSCDIARSYFWERKQGAEWGVYGAVTDSFLNIVTTYNMDGDSFRVIIYNDFEYDTSVAVLLDVTPDTAQITGHPSDQSIPSDSTAVFTITMSGDPTPTVQVQIWNGATWGDTSGETSTTFNWVTPDTSRDLDSVRFVITNDGGSDTSNPALLHVWPQYTIDTVFAAEVPISTNHASLVFDSGATVLCTLFCTPASGYAAIWQGGTVYYPSVDTLVVVVTGDSTVTAVAYAIPVIDSIVNISTLRDSIYTFTCRATDTLRLYGNIGTQGDSSKVRFNSTGTELYTIISGSWTADSVDLIPPVGVPRGVYKNVVMTGEAILGGIPVNFNMLFKAPSTGK